ncbi:MAG: isochorismatase family protein [Bacteroidota bacterium]
MRTTLVLAFLLIFATYNNGICQSRPISHDQYLLVLDVQGAFIDHKPYEKDARAMIASVNSILGDFSPEKIIYVKSAGKALSFSSWRFKTDTLPAPDFDNTLKIVSKNIFVKVSGDAFTSVDLIALLTENHAKEIVLAGLLAEECITNTALGGMERGYNITVIPEAITGKSEKSKEKAIRKLQEKGIKILPVNDLQINISR